MWKIYSPDETDTLMPKFYNFISYNTDTVFIPFLK